MADRSRRVLLAQIRLGRTLLGAIAGLAVWLWGQAAGSLEESALRVAAVGVTMIFWWLAEALPIAWTACAPLLLFPLLRVAESDLAGEIQAAWKPFFLNPYQALFAGGMMLAAAIEAQGLHRRLALHVLSRLGSTPAQLLAGVLTASAAVSLWISNTATAAMMLPIALAVVRQLEEREGRQLGSYSTALLLAVAWGANLGGIGTKIGTAPNSQLAGFLEQRGASVSFLEFLAIGLPFVMAVLPLAWGILWWMGRREAPATGAKAEVAHALAALGPTRPGEKRVALLFAGTAAAWISASLIGEPLRTYLPQVRGAALEGAIALLAASLAFLIPAGSGRRLLVFRELHRVPWSTLFLLGGGFSLAAAVDGSGLSERIALALRDLADLDPLFQVAAGAAVSVMLSAVASNTATTAVMLVVLTQAVSSEARLAALFAATIAASCDFALPVGTPPNAMVFASGRIRIPVMARYGVGLDLLAAVLAACWCSWMVPNLFGIEASVSPRP